MIGFEASLDIQAPLAIVWSVLSDVSRWPNWTPTVTSVEGLNGLELQVGAQFRLRQPNLQPAVWTVRSLTAGREFSWTSTGPGIQATAAHSIAAASNGATKLALSVQFSGILARVLWTLTGRLTREYVTREAQSLKSVAERASVHGA